MTTPPPVGPRLRVFLPPRRESTPDPSTRVRDSEDCAESPHKAQRSDRVTQPCCARCLETTAALSVERERNALLRKELSEARRAAEVSTVERLVRALTVALVHMANELEERARRCVRTEAMLRRLVPALTKTYLRLLDALSIKCCICLVPDDETPASELPIFYRLNCQQLANHVVCGACLERMNPRDGQYACPQCRARVTSWSPIDLSLAPRAVFPEEEQPSSLLADASSVALDCVLGTSPGAELLETFARINTLINSLGHQGDSAPARDRLARLVSLLSAEQVGLHSGAIDFELYAPIDDLKRLLLVRPSPHTDTLRRLFDVLGPLYNCAAPPPPPARNLAEVFDAVPPPESPELIE